MPQVSSTQLLALPSRQSGDWAASKDVIDISREDATNAPGFSTAVSYVKRVKFGTANPANGRVDYKFPPKKYFLLSASLHFQHPQSPDTNFTMSSDNIVTSAIAYILEILHLKEKLEKAGIQPEHILWTILFIILLIYFKIHSNMWNGLARLEEREKSEKEMREERKERWQEREKSHEAQLANEKRHAAQLLEERKERFQEREKSLEAELANEKRHTAELLEERKERFQEREKSLEAELANEKRHAAELLEVEKRHNAELLRR